VKIYDHPLNSSVTVIEIDNSDEQKEFLSDVIKGFDEFGNAYPSASCGEGEKKVIYLDGRKKVFARDEVDKLCDITVQLANFDGESDIAKRCITLAQAAGDNDLIERLMSQPPEYFSILKPVKTAA